eukprot:m.254584 g.254584  ORF g.254584 m.254584 type:complete len:58 (-) comp19018_c0_seq1:25-198(-)
MGRLDQQSDCPLGATCTIDTVAIPAQTACSEIDSDVTAAWAGGSVVRALIGLKPATL